MKLEDIILEAYIEVLREQEDVLTTSSEEILGKFPTLKKQLVKLFTDDYEVFIKEVKWIAPKPTTFEIVLSNNTFFTLRWTGKGFLATIEGKRYSLQNTPEFQQALDRINRLLQQADTSTPNDTSSDDSIDSQIDTPIDGDVTSDDFGFEEPTEEPE